MRVLCVDGGGVRGAAAAAALAELESELLAERGMGLYEAFDMFAGTSTGALIVAAIVYARMPASEIRDKVYRQTNMAHAMPTSIADLLFGVAQFQPKYDGKGKRDLIDEYTEATMKLGDTDKKVLFTAFDVSTGKPDIIKSWDTEDQNLNLRQVLDECTAAPGYFPIVTTDGRRFADGAIFANNPTDCAFAEALKSCDNSQTIVRVLSVGTGKHETTVHKEVKDHIGGLQWVGQYGLLDTVYTTPQDLVDYRMNVFATATKSGYVRVNGTLKQMAMDDTCDQNIITLKDRGARWYHEKKDEIWREIIGLDV